MCSSDLQTADVSGALSAAFVEAGGTGPRIAIRRVWIGDPPDEEMAAQMAHYRSYAPESAKKNWAGDQLIAAPTGEEAADRLAAFLDAAGCDAVNVRVHVSGLTPAQVSTQLDRHGNEFLPALRARLTP